MGELAKILLPKQEAYLKSVEGAVANVQRTKEKLDNYYSKVVNSLDAIQLSIEQSTEEARFMKDIGERLVTYVSQVKASVLSVSALLSPMSDANEILKHELDLAAGTEDISILIELVERRKEIKKALRLNTYSSISKTSARRSNNMSAPRC